MKNWYYPESSQRHIIQYFNDLKTGHIKKENRLNNFLSSNEQDKSGQQKHPSGNRI